MENKEQVQQEQSQRGRKSATLLLLLILLVTITVGFAVLSTSLNIRGNSKIVNKNWDVEPDTCESADDCSAIECEDGEVCTICTDGTQCAVPDDCTDTAHAGETNCKGAVLWMDGDTIYFKHILTKPGDTFTFYATFKNKGDIDAMIKNITKSEFNTTQAKFLTYDVTYANGSAVSEGAALNAGDSHKFKVTVAYKSTVTTLPTAEELAIINEATAENPTGEGASSLFTVNYEQKQ